MASLAQLLVIKDGSNAKPGLIDDVHWKIPFKAPGIYGIFQQFGEKWLHPPCSLGELPRMITLMLARRPCRRPWERSTRPPWKHHGAPTSFCKTPEKVGDSPKKLQIYIIYIIWLDFIQQKSLDSEGCPPTFEVSRRPWMALDSARRWSLQGMVSGSSLIFVLQRWEAAWFFS